MGRAPCCDKANVKRGPWSPEEDITLKNYIEKHGTGGNWIALPPKAGLKRCGKSCRLRWLNYLRPDIKHGGFTEEEDNIICTLYNNMGSRWSVIASHLPGRTDNDVKNYWNTKLKKKLLTRKSGLKSYNNNNNNITTNNTIHLRSAQFSASGANYDISACFDTNSSTVSYPMNVSYRQTFEPQRLVLDPIQFPLPRLMEVQDFSTSENNSYNTIPVSREVSSLSTSSSSLALDESYAPWSGNVGGEDGFLMDFEFGSSYDLLNGFGLQEKTGELSCSRFW